MDRSSGTRPGNTGSSPRAAEDRLDVDPGCSFGPLRRLKKIFLRIVRKILPKAILNLFSPVDTEQVNKELRDRGIRVTDNQQVRQIADALQPGAPMDMTAVMEIAGSDYTPVIAAARSCQIAGISCDYALPKEHGVHTPVFRDQNAEDQAPAAIVNAGSLDGHIGGAGLNKVFASVAPFSGAPHRQVQFQRDLHECLLAQGIGESHITRYELNARDSGMKSMTLYKTAGNHAGSVAVYEYAEPPCGNAANQAMVYVFPPRRNDYATDGDFLAAVEQTATNMITVYNHYASQKQGNHETVPELHIHAFSAGLYSGSVPAAAITKAILKGVHAKCQELSRDGTLCIPKMQFSAPFDHTLAHFGADIHYLDPPLPATTADQSLSEDDQAFLAFFNGDGQINGHTRQSISHYSFSRLESAHDYIQALFPNKARGTAEAPLLTPALLDVLNAAENKNALKKYIEDMLVHTLLPFWGIRHESTDADTGELDFSQGRFSIDDVQQSTVWRTKNMDHNHCRITRVLHFLVATGYRDYAQKLCQFMQEKRQEMRLPPIEYWDNAVQTPPDTSAVQTPPDADAVQTPPDADAVQAPPDADAVQTPPDTNAVQTPPDTNAVQTPPDTNAVQTPPGTNAVQHPPDTDA